MNEREDRTRDVRVPMAVQVCPICYFTWEGFEATFANLREHMREVHS